MICSAFVAVLLAAGLFAGAGAQEVGLLVGFWAYFRYRPAGKAAEG